MPWDWNILKHLKAAALKPLHAYLSAVLAQADTLIHQQQQQQQVAGGGGVAGGEGDCKGMTFSPALVKLLDGAVSFAYKVHSMVGGFDADCAADLDRLSPLWRHARTQRCGGN